MLQTRYLVECGEDESAFDVMILPGGEKDRPQCGEPKLLFPPTVHLSSGQDMPVLGFGTYNLHGYECSTAVHCAIETGFRHIDTAFYYENEREVGDAIRTQIAMGNVSRENIFLVDKLWNIHHDPKNVRRICLKQLELLGMDYIDLYLMHFPVAYEYFSDDMLVPQDEGKLKLSDVDFIDTWRAMEGLVREGLVRSIGVSNFNVEQIQRIIANCQFKPVVNQVEVWPGFMQKDLREYCRYNGIVVTAYAPLGQPDREKHTPIYFYSVRMKQICKQYSKKPAQITLRYLIDSGVVPIPMSRNPVHIKQNMDIFDFKLSDQCMAIFRDIKPKRRIVTYSEVKELKHPFYPFETDSEEEGIEYDDEMGMRLEKRRRRKNKLSRTRQAQPQRSQESPRSSQQKAQLTPRASQLQEAAPTEEPLQQPEPEAAVPAQDAAPEQPPADAPEQPAPEAEQPPQ